MNQYVLLCCIALGVVAHVSAAPPSKLVNGKTVAPNELPYQVSLRRRGMHYCGGALISEQHVLTAAHCIHRFTDEPEIIQVYTGAHNLITGGEKHSVAKVYTHALYEDRVSNARDLWTYDIGILKLTKPITINKYQKPVGLPKTNIEVGESATISGWGQKSSRSPPSFFLQKINMTIITNAQCKRKIPGVLILDNMMCAFERVGHGTCGGDSGGPMVYDNQIVGIVSGGIPCAVGFPDVFTRVYSFKDWVEEKISSDKDSEE